MPHRPAAATTKQIAYIRALLDERNLFASPRHFDAVNAMDHEEYARYLDGLKAQAATLTMMQASGWILRLKELPKKETEATLREHHATAGKITVRYEELVLEDGKQRRVGFVQVPGGAHEVPRGRYALETPGPEHRNDLTFFKVWVGERGGWSVRVHGSDETYDMSVAAQRRVLEQIAVDPAAASKRYGDHFGHCGVCGRGLTADDSRERGIGPVCAGRLGW